MLQISDVAEIITVTTGKISDTRIELLLIVIQVFSMKCKSLYFLQNEDNTNCSLTLENVEQLIQVSKIA